MTPGPLFRRGAADVVAAAFGPLEQRVLQALWEGGWSSVRDVQERLPTLAYTTLLTTLDRLYKKGVLQREKRGRAFVYAVPATREELERGVAAGLIGRLLSAGRAEPVLSCLVDAVGAQ